MDGKATLVNTLETIDLSVTKTWNDQGNKYNTRPENIHVTVERSLDGETWTPVVGNEADLTGTEWSAEFKALPKVDLTTGKAYQYRVVEKPVNGYSTKPAIFVGGKAELVNTLDTIDLSVTKTWNDQ